MGLLSVNRVTAPESLVLRCEWSRSRWRPGSCSRTGMKSIRQQRGSVKPGGPQEPRLRHVWTLHDQDGDAQGVRDLSPAHSTTTVRSVAVKWARFSDLKLVIRLHLSLIRHSVFLGGGSVWDWPNPDIAHWGHTGNFQFSIFTNQQLSFVQT